MAGIWEVWSTSPFSRTIDLAGVDVPDQLSAHQFEGHGLARDGNAPVERPEDERTDPERVAERDDAAPDDA